MHCFTCDENEVTEGTDGEMVGPFQGTEGATD